MYRRLFFGLIIALFVLGGCGKEEATHYSIDAKGPAYDTLEELEEDCTIIVRAIREENEVPVIQMDNDIMVLGYTFSQVTVKEVYKDLTEELVVGETIRILENEVYNEEENIIYHVAGYNMMEVGEEYILFLTKDMYYDEKPYYVASGVNYGTVSLEEDGRTTTYLNRNGNTVNDFSEMQPIWDAAIEKYGN